MKYEAVIFDLDGTLLDTLADLHASVNFALGSNSMPLRSLDEVRRFVGNGVRLLMERAVPDGSDNPLFEKVLSEFKEHYAANCKVRTCPYDGICDMLAALKERGIKTAIVSNKFDGAVKMLNTEYFGDLIPVAIGESPQIRKKPAPDTVFEALRLLECDVSNAVYVGDSEVDVQTAVNCGMDCISVTWGLRDIDVLKNAGASVFADSATELLDLLLA